MLHPGSEVHFLGPGTAFLEMKLPIGFCDFFRIKNPLFLFFGVSLGKQFLNPFGVDRPVDDDVGCMDTLGTELTDHGLGKGT